MQGAVVISTSKSHGQVKIWTKQAPADDVRTRTSSGRRLQQHIGQAQLVLRLRRKSGLRNGPLQVWDRSRETQGGGKRRQGTRPLLQHRLQRLDKLRVVSRRARSLTNHRCAIAGGRRRPDRTACKPAPSSIVIH